MLNKKFLVSALFLISSSSLLVANDVNLKKIDHTLSFQFVNISKTDVNRVICENGDIGKVIYSKDKEISIQKDGENAFIKLLPVTTKANGIIVNTVINDFIRDVYIECNKKMYSLNLSPTDTTAQTILLKNDGTSKNNEVAQSFERSNSFEKTIIDIVKKVYKDIEPDGYIVKKIDQKPISFTELSLIPIKTYTGNDFIVYEYKIIAKEDIEIDEKMFINFIANNPLALSLTELNLKKNQEARLFAITNSTPNAMSVEKIKIEQQVSNDSVEEKLPLPKTEEKQKIDEKTKYTPIKETIIESNGEFK